MGAAPVESHQLRSGDDDWDWEVETVEFFILMVQFFSDVEFSRRPGEERALQARPNTSSVFVWHERANQAHSKHPD